MDITRRKGKKGLQLLYLGGKNRKGSEERGKEIGACRGLSGEEFWCCFLPARSSRGGVHLGRPVLGRATMRGVSHSGRAARERKLGRAAGECSQRFFLSAVNGKFTEMVQISNGATFNAIFLKLDLLIVFF